MIVNFRGPKPDGRVRPSPTPRPARRRRIPVHAPGQWPGGSPKPASALAHLKFGSLPDALTKLTG